MTDKLYKEAIELDPDYIEPYVSLGWLNLIQYHYCISPEPQKSLDRALDLAEKAIAINAYSELPRALLGKMHEARAAAEEVLKIQPNFNSEEHIKAQADKNSADEKRFLSALKDAGLP